MQRFHFDPFDEATIQHLTQGEAGMTLIFSGVLGPLQRAEDPEAARQRFHEDIKQGMIDKMGEGTLYAALSGKIRHRSVEGKRDLDARCARVEEKKKQLAAELKAIKCKFEKDPTNPKGWKAGPPEYGAAVLAAVRRIYPPLMTVSRLREFTSAYLRKLLNIFAGGGWVSPADLSEMRLKVEFCAYWAERMELFDAPPPPPLQSPPRILREYLRALSHYLKTASEAEVWLNLSPGSLPDESLPLPRGAAVSPEDDAREDPGAPSYAFSVTFMEALALAGENRRGTLSKAINPKNGKAPKIEKVIRGGITYLNRQQFDAWLKEINAEQGGKKSGGTARGSTAKVPVGCNGYHCRECNEWMRDDGPLPAACPRCHKRGTVIAERRRSA